MSNKNRNQGNNGNVQPQEANTAPEGNQETFEGEVPMSNGKPGKPAEKKGAKEAVKEAWETEHTITWSGKGVAKKVGGFFIAGGLGAFGMWAWMRHLSDTSEDEDEYDDDVVAEAEYREAPEET